MQRILCVLAFFLESFIRGLYQLGYIFIKETDAAMFGYVISAIFVILIYIFFVWFGIIVPPRHLPLYSLLFPLALLFLLFWLVQALQIYYAPWKRLFKQAKGGC